VRFAHCSAESFQEPRSNGTTGAVVIRQINTRLVPSGGSGVPTGSTTPLFLSTNVLGLYAIVTLSGTVGSATATQLDHYDQRNEELTQSGQRRDGSCNDIEIDSGRR